MRSGVRGSKFHGPAVIALMLIVTVMAALVAPVGPRATAAQDEPTEQAEVTVQTRVRFLHAAPDLGEIEVLINFDEKLDNFAYGTTSEWIDLEPGAAELTLTQDRRGINYYVFDAVYPVPAGNDFYVVITDGLVIGGAVDRSPVPDGGARVQIVHASIDLPEVNVVATGANVDFASQLSYPRTSEAVTVPAGTYDLEVTLAETGETALTLPGVTLEGNSVYQLVVIGEPNDEDHPLTVETLAGETSERP